MEKDKEVNFKTKKSLISQFSFKSFEDMFLVDTFELEIASQRKHLNLTITINASREWTLSLSRILIIEIKYENIKIRY